MNTLLRTLLHAFVAPALLLVVVACGPVAPPQDASPNAGAVDSLRQEIARLSASLDQIDASPDRVRGAAGDTFSADIAAAARSYGLRSALALLILLLTALLVRGVVRILEILGERRPFFRRIGPIVTIVGWAIAITFILRVVFAGAGLIAAAVAIGIAVGFAARDILRDIFGGTVIAFDRPFRVGDRIGVGGTFGVVESIGLRSTRLITADDRVVTVPNARIVDGQVVTPASESPECQVVTDLYLPGWVDESLARGVARQVAVSSRYVHLARPVVVLVADEFRETFVTHLKVQAYVIDARFEPLFMSDITERARAEFRRLGLIGPAQGARAAVDLPAWSRTGAANGGDHP